MAYNYGKFIVWTLFSLMVLYVSPMLLSFNIEIGILPFRDNTENFNNSLYRSIFFSVVTSIFTVFLSFLIAVSLFRIDFFSKTGKNLSFLLMPVLLGSITSAFIYKLLLTDSQLIKYLLDDNPITLFIFLGLLQFWQYGSLAIYLFWLTFQGIPKTSLEYAQAYKLSFGVILKDIIVPASKNLFILLLIICFIFNFYEDAKANLVFHFSRGTDTELINGWLQRLYQQKTAIFSPIKVAPSFYSYGLLVLFSAILILFLLTFIINIFIKSISKGRFFTYNVLTIFRKSPNIRVGKVITVLLLITVILPILTPFLELKATLSKELITLFTSFALTLTASLWATFIALVYSIFARLGWKNILTDFNSKSLLFFILTFFLLLIAPLCIYLLGFVWLDKIGYQSSLYIGVSWVIMHGVLALPMLGGFLLSVHFRFKNKEIDYLNAYNISQKEILKWSFLKRFGMEYLLTLIFSFSFIWNDYGINTVLSDHIPSFATVLKMSFSGRGANESLGLGYFMVSVIVSLTSILVWKYILSRVQKSIE